MTRSSSSSAAAALSSTRLQMSILASVRLRRCICKSRSLLYVKSEGVVVLWPRVLSSIFFNVGSSSIFFLHCFSQVNSGGPMETVCAAGGDPGKHVRDQTGFLCEQTPFSFAAVRCWFWPILCPPCNGPAVTRLLFLIAGHAAAGEGTLFRAGARRRRSQPRREDVRRGRFV